MKTYILCNQNASLTASSLFIHRSTFIAHMEKIKAILHSDLKNFQDVIHLFLSFRLLGETMETIVESESANKDSYGSDD